MTIVGILANPEVRTGGHRRYLELLRQLAGRGHRIVLLKHRRLHPTPLPAQFTLLDVTATSGRPPLGFAFDLALRVFIRRRDVARVCDGADLILIHGHTNAMAGLVVQRMTGAPLVFDPREVLPEYVEARAARGGGWRALRRGLRVLKALLQERLIMRRADYFIFQTSYDADLHVVRHPIIAGRCSIIPNSMRASWFSREYALSNQSGRLSRLLFVGTLDRRKGVELLIEAMNRLRLRKCNLTLQIAGSGELESEIGRLIAGYNLEEQVTMTGWAESSLALMRDSDLLVVPSLVDLFPDSILEALHVGIAVLASSLPGMREMLGHEELLFPPGDVGHLAERIASLSESESAFRRVGDLCRSRRVLFDFDWGERVEGVLQTVL